jgi:hypothetical protein
MKTILLILGVWLLTGISGCTKDTTSWQSSDIKFYPEATEFLNIPANTNFTYQDAFTGDLYPVTVQSNAINRVYQPGYIQVVAELKNEAREIPDHYYQELKMVMAPAGNDSRNLKLEFNTIDPVAAYNSNYFNIVITANASINKEPVWNGVVFCLPTPNVSEVIPSVIVNGVTYHNALKVGSNQSSFWWVKGVGIIKMVMVNEKMNRTFILVE